MKVTLTQAQRIFVAILYLIVLIILFTLIDGNLNELLWKSSDDRRIWFFSGALLIILGKYIAEPFFSKPTDAIANSTAVIITLLTLNNKDKLVFYEVILGLSLLVLLLSLLTILLKNFNQENDRIRKLNEFSYKGATGLGNYKVLFTCVYLASVYSYFLDIDEPNIVASIVLIFFWYILVSSFDIIGKIVEQLGILFTKKEEIEEELGHAIGCENPLLYNVEIDFLTSKNSKIETGDLVTIQNEKLNKSLGVVINKRHLLNKYWLEVYLLTDIDNNIIKISQRHRSQYLNDKKILQYKNSAKKLKSIDLLPESLRNRIMTSKLYINKDRFVGYIERESNVNQIVFLHLGDKEIKEGDIIVSDIYDDEVLFQIIDGQTREEPLEYKDGYGYEVGYARKVGNYDEDQNELNVVSWLPKIYTPVYAYQNFDQDEERLAEIAQNSIGRLPQTTMEIPIKDYNALVTHNTAILGILGIGKSCLTFELIKKTINNIEGIKVICIDITNEYGQEEKLPQYITAELIQKDDVNSFNEINAKFEYIETIGEGTYAKQIPDKSGNIDDYRSALKADLINFLFNSDEIPEEYEPSEHRKIRIYNPDYHKVSKGEKMGIHVLTPALSPAEKTRVITEEILRILMKFPPVNDGSNGKVFVVFEEAHSLVPEWNSVANDGDKTAVNGTAKVMLQGRKYGLGSLVITQRTANISKSILNQCNTIFALRVFDDTGKQFLENYIGSDYSNTLPTLEERHAIAVGKALKLKQPIIIRLNDMNHVKEG